MDPAQLTNLLPLGGASVLLIYLLRIISYERGRWIRERATLNEECRAQLGLRDAEIVRLNAELDRREADFERHLSRLDRRYEVLRQDYLRLLEEHEQRRKGSGDR